MKKPCPYLLPKPSKTNLNSHVTSKKTKFVLKPLPYQSNNKNGKRIHNIAL